MLYNKLNLVKVVTLVTFEKSMNLRLYQKLCFYIHLRLQLLFGAI